MHAIMKLHLGVKVHFKVKEGQVFGSLIKINRKCQRQLKISPGLENLMEEITPP